MSNPESFDLVVLGTGAAGSATANRCRAAGWRVAIVDDEPYGGTCALRGCDPKKVLVGAAALVDWSRRMVGAGIMGDARVDWADLMRFKRTFTKPAPPQQEAAFQAVGVATYHGVARFVSEDCLRIGERELQATHFVVATGAEPKRLDIPGEEHVRTSTEFLGLDELPRRIALITRESE